MNQIGELGIHGYIWISFRLVHISVQTPTLSYPSMAKFTDILGEGTKSRLFDGMDIMRKLLEWSINDDSRLIRRLLQLTECSLSRTHTFSLAFTVDL